VAEWRSINHPHLKDDEFDIIDLIKIEGYLKNLSMYICLFT